MSESPSSSGQLQVISKADTFTTRLASGASVYVSLQHTLPGVSLPAQPGGRPYITLVFARALAQFMGDISITDEGFTASLSFNHVMSEVTIPWRAVFAITDGNGDGLLWLEDAPASVIASITQPAAPVPAAQPPARPAFTLLAGGKN